MKDSQEMLLVSYLKTGITVAYFLWRLYVMHAEYKAFNYKVF